MGREGGRNEAKRWHWNARQTELIKPLERSLALTSFTELSLLYTSLPHGCCSDLSQLAAAYVGDKAFIWSQTRGCISGHSSQGLSEVTLLHLSKHAHGAYTSIALSVDWLHKVPVHNQEVSWWNPGQRSVLHQVKAQFSLRIFLWASFLLQAVDCVLWSCW